jgi:hypothetical protein
VASHTQDPIPRITAPGAPQAATVMALPRRPFPLVDWLGMLTLLTLILASPLLFDLAVHLGMAR